MADACKGRHNEAVASVSVNSRNYRVNVQDSSRAGHHDGPGPGPNDVELEDDTGPASRDSDGESVHVTIM
jgi:hypothetical protein